MKVDYIIVGFGLAGLSIAEKLRKENKSFVVIDNGVAGASKVAGGIFNPVILKRFTMAWEAEVQLPFAIDFYKEIEQLLQVELIHFRPILRRFNSVEEQNNWFAASDKNVLEPFLDSVLVPIVNELNSEFFYGKVNQTGFIDTIKLIESYKEFLNQNKLLLEEQFSHEFLEITNATSIRYKQIEAANIIFNEGYGLVNNPLFSYLPLVGNKGEYLTIKCERLKLDELVKFSLFILPLGGNLYKVGATYNRDFDDNLPSNEARIEIKRKLDEIIKVPYEVVNQEAGIRPTTKDRRPLLGRHPKYYNVYINNGYGSRGVIIAPTAAVYLYNFIENEVKLPKEISISRFS